MIDWGEEKKSVQRLGCQETAKTNFWWRLPGGPVVRTLSSQCRGPGFDPWWGNKVPHAPTKDLACHN